MDDHTCLARAETEFREAVQQEQSALMASGVCCAEATEILLGRLRGNRGKASANPSPTNASPSRCASPRLSPPEFPSAEFATLVNVHGYSAEDATRALTICHEIRLLEAAGVGGVAAAEELTRRVLCGGGNSAVQGRCTQNPLVQGAARGSDVGASGTALSRGNDGGAVTGVSGGGRRHSRGAWTSHRSIREEMRADNSSSSDFLAPPWEPPLQECVNHGAKGVQDGAGGISGGEHILGYPARGGTAGSDPKGSISMVVAPSPGGRSPRLGGRKRQHGSMWMQHSCGGVFEQGSFPPPLPPRTTSGGGGGGFFGWSSSTAGTMMPCASRGGAGGGSNGSVAAGGMGVGSAAAMASSSAMFPVHSAPPGEGTNRMNRWDGMDISSALIQAPAAKRPRCHGSSGGEEGDRLTGREDPRQLVFVDQGHRQEEQEQQQQLQRAFHQLGVRQRNTRPQSPPLASGVPPKRPRTRSEEPPSAPCKRTRHG